MQPLTDLIVLDLSRHLPGPYLTRVLTDLGANVIKIESREGDPLRFIPPFLTDDSSRAGMGATFAALNFGKRSLALDLKHSAGADVLRALVRRADVLVESFRPGVMRRLGLDYAALSVINPRLIMCSISGYGQDGPLAGTPGHDLNFVARAGILSFFETADGPPVVPGVQIADVMGGSMSAAVGILAALWSRQRRGRGQHLDISMARSAMGLMTMELARRSLGVVDPAGGGMLTGGLPAYRVYRTRDGRFMALAALEPKFFVAFCERAGCPELSPGGLSSGADGQRVIDSLQALFASRTQAEWVALLAGCDCCCEPVQTPEEALEDAAIGALSHHIGGARLLAMHMGFAAAMSQDETTPRLARLGEHSHEVARELDVEADIVNRAVAAGAMPSAS